MRFCLDVLGAAQYQDVVFKNVPKEVGLGVFYYEFDKGKQTGKQFITKAVKKGYEYLRVQVCWSHNNHKYDNSFLPQLKQACIYLNKLAVMYPTTHIEISPFCEHLLPNPDKYLDKVAKWAPHCVPINSPVQIGNQKGAFSKKYKNEVHGSHASALAGSYNFSFDGNDCFNADVKSIKSNLSGCDLFFFWAPGFNLHRDENDKERNSPPTTEYMQAVLYLFGEKGTCVLPPNSLWKPMSEKWKPVLITPIKVDKAVLVKDGVTIGTSLPPMPYVDGRWRYYFNTQGYKLGVCDVYANGKIGTVDAGFRVNDYR